MAQQQQAKTTMTVKLDDISMEIDKDYLVYLWNRILHTIGNPNAIKNPNIFAAAISGIFQMVTMFLSSTHDGNSILAIFGSWLFEAIKTIRFGFDEGVSLATEILANIFHICSAKISFEPIYLASFYSCLSEVLWCDGKILFSGIIHTQMLLATELPGCRILVPSYIRALGRILTIIPGSSSEYLRRSAIRILGQIMCLSNRFENVQFYHFFNKRPMEYYPPLPSDVTGKHELLQPDLNVFRDVRLHVAHLILSSLNTETSPSNLSTLIWYILEFQLEHQHRNVTLMPDGKSSTVAFINTSINIILKKATSFTGQWPAEVITHAFQLLSVLATHHASIPTFVQLAHTVVRKLCKFIIFKSREVPISIENEELIVLALHTIGQWVVVSGWIFDGNYKTDTSTLYMLFDALTIALGGKNPNEETSSNASTGSGSGGISGVPLSGQSSQSSPFGVGSLQPPASASTNSPATSSSSSSNSSGGQSTASGANGAASATPAKTRKITNNPHIPSRIKDIAQCTFDTIMNRMSNFPNPYNFGPTSQTSSAWKEDDIIESIRAQAKQAGEPNFPVEQCIRFYSINDATLITMIDQPFGANGPYTTIIIRDSSGRYVINADLAYLPFKPKDENDGLANGGDRAAGDSEVAGAWEEDKPLSVLPARSSTDGHKPFTANYSNQEDFTEIQSYLSNKSDSIFQRSTVSLIKTESDVLSTLNYGLEPKIALQAVKVGNRYQGDCKFQNSRLLLSNLGFLSLESKGKVSQMENTVTFYQAICSLDQVPERLQSRVGVLYVKENDTTEEEVYSNVIESDTPKDYIDYVSSLGWMVDLPTHKGYLGGLDTRGMHGKYAPYYANSATETIFHVPTHMPNQGTSIEHKRKLLSKDSVVIVWYEGTLEQYEQLKLETISSRIQIVITPLDSELFRVKTYKGVFNKTTGFGPIVNDDIIVSKHILHEVTKSTAVNAFQQLSTSDTKNSHPFIQRRRMIYDISISFKRELSVQQNYSNTFQSLDEDQYYKTPVFSSSTELDIFKQVKPSQKSNTNNNTSISIGTQQKEQQQQQQQQKEQLQQKEQQQQQQQQQSSSTSSPIVAPQTPGKSTWRESVTLSSPINPNRQSIQLKPLAQVNPTSPTTSPIKTSSSSSGSSGSSSSSKNWGSILRPNLSKSDSSSGALAKDTSSQSSTSTSTSSSSNPTSSTTTPSRGNFFTRRPQSTEEKDK
ncbi:RapGAP/RanGAP domain-containing protein [Heterostelium album PN500]|uniref:RapGAP/RanGAP domain-containing protein n=1 Tax=Heterostelium pallidum (strain ATCC 26659 / Pp 5 / PN500) TaxID=670386 RepID=D3BAE0_HETP5|nr:RapGAP/RanGAP domain-containing protein [Heterostelium album PN500]EFA81527.1 RapGAP/RanGAP domain-containing protein [Heterostelium album PN500]|eukprot:XP_020433644.1 RapGAP/RanGAP domain-containing protein [Heterostelium album PN500]